ncbi:MAG TPA: rhombosortase [Geomonas sp.]|nr:rhombosortase [Geomonas sp.]
MLPLMIAIDALVVTMSPALSALFVYDRQLIESGELWRMVTAHLVHFSVSHLFFDLCGFLLSAWYCHRRGYRQAPWVIASAALATTGAIFLLQPDMARYGGLSGVADALIVFAAVRGMAEKGGMRWPSLTVLIACCGNIGFQLLSDRGTLEALAGQPFVPAAGAHLVGAIVGAAVAAATS